MEYFECLPQEINLLIFEALDDSDKYALKCSRRNVLPSFKTTTETVLKVAIKNGYLAVLQWLIKLPSFANKLKVIAICNEAAKHGHLAVLQWARENGYE